MDVQQMLIDSLDLADRIHAEATTARENANGDHNEMPNDNEDPPEEGVPAPDMSQSPLGMPPQFDEEQNGNLPPSDTNSAGDEPQSRDVDNMEVDEEAPGTDAPPDIHGGRDVDFVDDEELSWGENNTDNDAAVAALEEAVATPLYHGSEHSSMGATYLLLSSSKLHKCSNIYLDELFRTLSMMVLPQPNSLSRSYQEASEYLKRLRHSFKSIDVCPNNCVLFRGEL